MSLAVEKTIHLDASPERVWRAITEADELAAWFPESLEWEARLGGEGWFGWESHGCFAARIETFEPPRFLAWRWAREPDTELDEGDSTLVEWTLTRRENGGTTLHLRESGFARDESRRQNDAGWDHELGELVEHLGEPDAAIT